VKMIDEEEISRPMYRVYIPMSCFSGERVMRSVIKGIKGTAKNTSVRVCKPPFKGVSSM
jgi:hypothetical protein